MTDREYMELALFEAEKAEREGEIPIGAVLVFATPCSRRRITGEKQTMTRRRMRRS